MSKLDHMATSRHRGTPRMTVALTGSEELKQIHEQRGSTRLAAGRRTVVARSSDIWEWMGKLAAGREAAQTEPMERLERMLDPSKHRTKVWRRPAMWIACNFRRVTDQPHRSRPADLTGPRRALTALIAATAAAFGALGSPPALATSHGQKATTGSSRYGHEARRKPCKPTHVRHGCRHTSKLHKPGSPSHPGSPAGSPTAPGNPTAPGTPGPTGGPPTPGGGPGAGGSSPAAQFARALIGTTYEHYTSSLLGSDFTDDYTFCLNNTFLEHTESYDGNGGYVVSNYSGTWNVTNALSATSANVAYTTNNPNLPSSGTVLISLVPNGLDIGSNGYYTKGPASC